MKKLIIYISFFICNFYFSQNITCKYILKYKPNTQKDSLVTNLFYLDIYGKQSIFRSELERYSDSLISKNNLGMGRKILFATDLFSKKNLETHEVQKIIITPFMRSRFFIKIADQLNWKITTEKQKIGELNCQKAELDYGGRHWTAWFSQTINFQEGPYVFNGLPGLIVKISDSHLDYDFTLIQLQNSKNTNFFISTSGKEIQWEDFQKIIKNYYNDPFYEVKSSGMKMVFGDDKGNISTINPNIILKKAQKNFRLNGNNLLELNKAIELK